MPPGGKPVTFLSTHPALPRGVGQVEKCPSFLFASEVLPHFLSAAFLGLLTFGLRVRGIPLHGGEEEKLAFPAPSPPRIAVLPQGPLLSLHRPSWGAEKPGQCGQARPAGRLALPSGGGSVPPPPVFSSKASAEILGPAQMSRSR